MTGDDLVEERRPTQEEVWGRLVGRANEERTFINGQPVTALLDTGSQVMHVSHNFSLTSGIQIHPITQLVNIEGTRGDTIEYVGYAKAKLFLYMGSQNFNIEALLLVLPTTKYQKRVPVAIGTTITDMVVDFINQNKSNHVPKSWKVVCCATHSKSMVQAQPQQKGSIKTTKPITLSPFSTTIVKGNTKLRRHGMWLNLIAELSSGTQLPSGIQCAPTYCTLEPGSSRVAVGLRNLSSWSIKIPSQFVVGQLQQATIHKAQASGKQNRLGLFRGKEGVLDQLDLKGLDAWMEDQQQAAKDLFVDSVDVFSGNNLDLGKCNILKQSINIMDPQLFKERY